MRSKYQDVFYRWHDKPVYGGLPSSNNGWVYTAYAKELGLLKKENEFSTIKYYFKSCKRNNYPLKIDRIFGIKTPPISKDEIIGLVYMGYLAYEELKNSDWNFCNLDEYDQTKTKLTFKTGLKALFALYKLRNGHRNDVWKLKVVEAYPLAFRLMPWDKYYVKKVYGKEVSIYEIIMFALNFWFVLFSDNFSTRNLLWLQLRDMKYFKMAKMLNPKANFYNYFKDDHPFREALK